MSIEVRHARAEDVGALVALHREVHELHLQNRPDQFRQPAEEEVAASFRGHLEAPGSVVWVAEVASQIVGYALAIEQRREGSPFVPARHWCEVDQIGVTASHRRQGIGRALLQSVAEDARASGISTIELSSWSFNTDAHRAFETFGFEPKMLRFQLRSR